jgi:hypothetical protein
MRGWEDAEAGAQFLRRVGYNIPDVATTNTAPLLIRTVAPLPGTTVACKPLPEDRYKSKTERRFAQLLDVWKYEGTVKQWWYEPMKLRLADTCFFTPDFLVMPTEASRLLCYEVKGFWREDARIKIKVAAQHYPCFSFIAAQYTHGLWKYEQF